MSAYLLPLLVLLPFAGGFAAYPLGRRSPAARDLLVAAVAAAEFILSLLLLGMRGLEGGLEGVCGFGLHFAAGGFGTLLAVLTTFLWLATAAPSREFFAHRRRHGRPDRYYLFYLLTLGAMLGVSLSADLYTTFVFFEIMSFTSYVWVVQTETPAAIRAGESYLAIAVIGGLVLLMGVFLLQHLLGTLELDRLAELAAAVPPEKRGLLYAAGACCLFGFGAKAGMFPLHVWMPKAYPAAPEPAAALLSGILSKAGVFGVAVLSGKVFLHDAAWGGAVLAFGAVTMAVGAGIALFAPDLKVTLAGSSMSQIGFILVGAGMQGLLGEENALAVWGTATHLVNHSLIKLILFVAAGVVCNTVGSSRLDDVRGFGRGKPWLMLTFLAAGLSVSGVPLTSGYVSKTLLHESLVEYIRELTAHGAPTGLFRGVEALFLFTGGLTLAYMAKLFVALFVEKPAKGQPTPRGPSYMTAATGVSLAAPALLLLAGGLLPHGTMEKLAVLAQGFFHGESPAEPVHYFVPANLEGAGISLAVGAAVYLLFVRKVLRKRDGDGQAVYPDRRPAWLDLEGRVYRPLLRGLAFAGAFVSRVAASLGDWVVLLGQTVLFFRAPRIVAPKYNEDFGVYGKDPERDVVTETFSYDLMMAGIGLVVTLLYLLLS